MGRRTRHTEHMATNERGRPPLPQVNGIQWSEAGNNTLTKWGNAGQRPPDDAHVVVRKKSGSWFAYLFFVLCLLAGLGLVVACNDLDFSRILEHFNGLAAFAVVQC